jgi:hypothetical protein
MRADPEMRKLFRTGASNLGAALVDIDDAWEAIAHAEGEDFR